MTNQEISEKFSSLVKTERKITLEILHLINLVEDRKLHLERGFGSLHDWLIREHKYSETSANRRIQAARLLRSVPEVSEKINSGIVNLSTLAKTQSIIRSQERITGKQVSLREKEAAIGKIENQTQLNAEQSLIALFPETASQVRQDRVTVIDENTQRLGVNLSNEAIADLKRAKETLSHTVPSGQSADVIAHVLREFVKRMDPLKKKNSPAVAHRAIRRNVIQQAKGGCTFKDRKTNRTCGSRYQIEIDHIIPKALGGDDSPENLRALCRKHNLLMAEKILGLSAVNRWRTGGALFSAPE